MSYEHTHTGWVALVGLAALPVAWLDADPTHLPLISEAAVRILGTGIILLMTVIFSRLTVRVGGGELSWHFGTDEPVALRDAIEGAAGESPIGAGRSQG